MKPNHSDFLDVRYIMMTTAADVSFESDGSCDELAEGLQLVCQVLGRNFRRPAPVEEESD